MNRWRTGTTDHDNDGKMGGSLKETDMAKVAPKKKLTLRPAAEPVEPVAGVDAEADAKAAVDAVKAKKAAVAEQFAEADAKAAPTLTPKEERAAHNAAFEAASEEERAAMLADLQVQRSVRGW